jgi:uncharacterized protein (DUF885 family)
VLARCGEAVAFDVPGTGCASDGLRCDFEANTGLTERNIVSEVERYIAWPGQALAYKTGQMAIQELRREAEQVLGEAFDIRRFHDHLLGAGSLPLDILRRRMARWLAQELGRRG